MTDINSKKIDKIFSLQKTNLSKLEKLCTNSGLKISGLLNFLINQEFEKMESIKWSNENKNLNDVAFLFQTNQQDINQLRTFFENKFQEVAVELELLEKKNRALEDANRNLKYSTKRAFDILDKDNNKKEGTTYRFLQAE